MPDARLLMRPTNAMHRNGAYNCALPKLREDEFFVCSTNWDLYIYLYNFCILNLKVRFFIRIWYSVF